jgi:succinoglycan biosynthesis protein ExoO
MRSDATLTVSVVIPAFDAASYVGAAVRSALNQSLRDLEVLVVDDGSSDGTGDAAARAAGGDSRLRVIRQPRNLGVSAARNAALRVARGRWIALLDADDELTPARLEKLVTFAESCNADLAADEVVLIRDRIESERLFVVPRRFARRAVGAADFIALDSPTQPIGYIKPIMRRSFLEQHDLHYPHQINVGEDFHLYVRCLLHGAKLRFVREAGYLATARPGSLSRSNAAQTFAVFRESTRLLREEASMLGDHRAAKALTRRDTDLRSYDAYNHLSDALHRRKFRQAIPMFWKLSRASYTWRRFGSAARRRLLPG